MAVPLRPPKTASAPVGVDFEEADHVEEIWQSIKDGERGVIVDVRDEEDNEHVQIYLD